MRQITMLLLAALCCFGAAWAEPVVTYEPVPQEAAIDDSAIRFTRSVSGTNADEDGSVTITYRVENLGTEPLTDLRVTDSAGRFSERLDELAAGDMAIFAQRIDVSRAVTSSPELTCEYMGASIRKALADQQIGTETPALTLALTVTPADDDTVTVRMTMTNDGGVTLRDLVVTDDERGGLIAEIASLAPGESVTAESVCPVSGGSSYRWRVDCLDDMDDRLSKTSDTAEYTAPERERVIALSLTASAEKTVLRRAGYTSVTVSVANTGTDSARDVRLADEERGTLYTFAVIPAGEPITRALNVEVTEDTELNLRLEYTDEDGHLHTVYSDPIALSVSRGGEEPDPEPSRHPLLETLTPTAPSDPNLYGLLLGIGCVLVAALVLLLAVQTAIRRRRNAEDEEDDEEEDEDDPEDEEE